MVNYTLLHECMAPGAYRRAASESVIFSLLVLQTDGQSGEVHISTYHYEPSPISGTVERQVGGFSFVNDLVVTVNHLRDGTSIHSLGRLASFPLQYSLLEATL